jgi:hypothetical protein
MRLMDYKFISNQDESSVWSHEFSRDGTHGEIRGRFWATRDRETGELTFYAKLPNVVRDFQEDFDVCILVVAWGLWTLASKLSVFAREDNGLSDEENCLAFLNTTRFIHNGIEAWLAEQGKLARAGGHDRDENGVLRPAIRREVDDE